MPDVQRTPPYEQVVAYYRSEICSGRMKAGDELPSTRRLAEEWKIAISTAQRALEALRDGGWIETRPGRPPIVKPQHVPSRNG